MPLLACLRRPTNRGHFPDRIGIQKLKIVILNSKLLIEVIIDYFVTYSVTRGANVQFKMLKEMYKSRFLKTRKKQNNNNKQTKKTYLGNGSHLSLPRNNRVSTKNG